MKADDPRNKLQEDPLPGMWVDQAGHVHFSLPDIMTHLGMPDTPENREFLTNEIKKMIKEFDQETTVMFRETPTDDGKEI